MLKAPHGYVANILIFHKSVWLEVDIFWFLKINFLIKVFINNNKYWDLESMYYFFYLKNLHEIVISIII